MIKKMTFMPSSPSFRSNEYPNPRDFWTSSSIRRSSTELPEFSKIQFPRKKLLTLCSLVTSPTMLRGHFSLLQISWMLLTNWLSTKHASLSWILRKIFKFSEHTIFKLDTRPSITLSSWSFHPPNGTSSSQPSLHILLPVPLWRFLNSQSRRIFER